MGLSCQGFLILAIFHYEIITRINFFAFKKGLFGGIINCPSIHRPIDIAVFKEDYQDMSAATVTTVTTPNRENEGAAASEAPCDLREHLHLHMRRTHWATCHHENLGAHLQDALTALDREGWEVVAAYVVGQTPEVILRRTYRPLDA